MITPVLLGPLVATIRDKLALGLREERTRVSQLPVRHGYGTRRCPHVSAPPRISPTLHHPIHCGEGVFSLEDGVFFIEDRLPGPTKGVTTLVANAVRPRFCGLKDTIVGDEQERCVEVVCRPGRPECFHDGKGIYAMAGETSSRPERIISRSSGVSACPCLATACATAASRVSSTPGHRLAGNHLDRHCGELRLGNQNLSTLTCVDESRLQATRSR